MTKRETLASVGLFILRVAFGCLMFIHGWQKLTAFESLAEKFPDPIGLGSKVSLISAIAAEAGCSVLLIVGAATRLAVIPLAFTMIVALFVVHANDPWKVKELAAVYLGVYVALFLTGPGRFSLDGLLWSRQSTITAAN